jgi:hypothetical protein
MKFMFALQNLAEQVGSNGTTAHFYSRDTWFNTKLGHQLSKFVLWISLVAAGKCQDSTLNYIGTSSFQIISNSSHVTAHVVSCQPLTPGGGARFIPRSVHAGFVVERVVLEYAFLQILQVLSVSTTPTMLHTYSFIYH